MNHIKFKCLNDLLLFLNSCERGESLGKTGRRGLFEFVHAARDCYAVAYSAKDWNGQGNLFGGVIVENAPETPGNRIHLNELLRGIYLADSPTQSVQLPTLVLAIPSAPMSDSEKARQHLHEAWREIPTLENSESRFFFKTDDQKRVGCHAVEISNVDPAFNYEMFRRRHGEPLKAFVPAWDEDKCFLYVEWGFRYPKATDFYYLYDEGREGGGSQLVLCTAGPILPLAQGPNGKASRVWRKPVWHLVGAESYWLVEQLFHCDLENPAPVINLDQWIDQQESIPLPLAIGETGKAVGAVSDLDRAINSHERELARLRSRRARLVQLGHQEFFPVYVWYQRAESGADCLPAGLEEFLKRPLGELGRFNYARVAVEGGFRHYAAGDVRVTAGSELAVACDHVYLCEARWAEWNLPLYVRSDCALSVLISEAGLANKVWELLEAQNIPRDARIILAEPCALPPGATAEDIREIQFAVLTPDRPLDQALLFTNEKGQGPPAVARLAGELIAENVFSHNVSVSQHLGQIDNTLLTRTRELLASAETTSEQLRTRLQAVLLEARVADIVLQLTEQYYKDAPQTWIEFVNRVFATDQRIADMKLQGLQQWTQADTAREEQLKQIAQAQKNVAKEIEDLIKKYNDLFPVYQAQNEATRKKLAELEEAKGKILAENVRLAAHRGELAGKNAELEKSIRKLELDLKSTQQELKHVREKQTKASEHVCRLQELQADLEEKMQRCAGEESNKQIALDQLRMKLAQAGSFLEMYSPPEPQPEQEAAPAAKSRRWFWPFSRR